VEAGSADGPHHADFASPLQHVDPHRPGQAERADDGQQDRHDHQEVGDDVKLGADLLLDFPNDIHMMHAQAVFLQMFFQSPGQSALIGLFGGLRQNLDGTGPAGFLHRPGEPVVGGEGERSRQGALGNADHRELQAAVSQLDYGRAADFQVRPVFHHVGVDDQRVFVAGGQPASGDDLRFDHLRIDRRGHDEYIFACFVFGFLAGVPQDPSRSEAPTFHGLHAGDAQDFLLDPAGTETFRKGEADIVMEIVHRLVQGRIQGSTNRKYGHEYRSGHGHRQQGQQQAAFAPERVSQGQHDRPRQLPEAGQQMIHPAVNPAPGGHRADADIVDRFPDGDADAPPDRPQRRNQRDQQRHRRFQQQHPRRQFQPA